MRRSASCAGLLVERTGGVPLFIEEMSRLLIDKGVMQSGLRGYRLQAKLNEIRLPETMQGVLAARMDGLPPGSPLAAAGRLGHRDRSAAGSAAEGGLAHGRAAGRADRPAQGGRVPVKNESPAAPCCNSSTRSRSAFRTRPCRFRAGARCTRRCAARSRSIIADRIGEWTERLGGARAQGGSLPKAIGYLHLAGHRANDRGLHHAAIDCFEKALAALDNLMPDQIDPRRLIEIHLGLASRSPRRPTCTA